MRKRCAECDCGDGPCNWIAAGPMDPRYEPRIGPLEFWSAPIAAIIIVVLLAYWLKH